MAALHLCSILIHLTPSFSVCSMSDVMKLRACMTRTGLVALVGYGRSYGPNFDGVGVMPWITVEYPQEVGNIFMNTRN